MTSDINWHGLLYIDPAAGRPVNAGDSTSDPVALYVANAMTLARSLARFGQVLTLVTNEPERIAGLLSQLGGRPDALAVRPMTFRWDVPPGIRFRAAHYKLELIEAFATGQFGARPGLVDLDAVMIRPFTLSDEALIAYDLTFEAECEYGPAVKRDVRKLAVDAVDPRWYGGECIVGTVAGFTALAEQIRQVWPLYLAQMPTIHHVGDEAVLSAAIGRVAQHLPIGRAAGPGGVIRYWTVRTTSPEPRLSESTDRSILHLPAEKALLERWAAREFDPDAFLRDLAATVRRGLPRQAVGHLRDWILGKRTYLPRL